MAALVSNNDGGIPLEEFPLGFDTGGHYSLCDLTASSVFVVTAFSVIYVSPLDCRTVELIIYLAHSVINSISYQIWTSIK